MPWVKLTDDFYDDEKLKRAGPLGLALWVVGIGWSLRNLKDGFVPFEQVDCLLSWRGVAWKMWHGELVGGGEDADAYDIAHHLVDVGLWQEVPNGFRIVNFEKYQPSSQQVIAAREKERQRWHERKSSRSDTAPRGVETEPPPTPPVPVPVPPGITSSSSSTSSTAPLEDEEDVETALTLYVERKLAAQPVGSVKQPGPWKRQVLANARVEDASQVRTWFETYDVTPSQVADALLAGGPSASWNNYRRQLA